MSEPIDRQRRQVLGSGAGLVAAAGSVAVLAGGNATAAPTRGHGTANVARMQAWEVGPQTGLGSLRLTTRARPAPGPGQVLVKVHAAALNHRDLYIVSGQYGARKADERIAAGDGAGEIFAVGDGVAGFAIGERVTAPHFQGWRDGAFSTTVLAADAGNTADGWLAEYILLPASALVRVPAELDYAEAAALGAAGITAWNSLLEFGGMQAGDTVLTLGTGGVSAIVLQLARMHGARCAITSSSDEKLALAREQGAAITVNYRQRPDWDKAVLEATGGRGCDIITETVGQNSLGQSCACIAANGRIALIGNLGGKLAPGQAMPALGRNASTLRGILSGSASMLERVLQAYAVNRTKPWIDRHFAFADAATAYSWLEAGNFFGKIVIDV